jgi:hypothetical protein
MEPTSTKKSARRVVSKQSTNQKTKSIGLQQPTSQTCAGETAPKEPGFVDGQHCCQVGTDVGTHRDNR